MSFEEIIQFGIALNVTAGLGAAGFAWLDDRIGSKQTVQIGIIGLIVFGVPLLVVESKTAFWLLALPLGIFMGPVQAASRSLMAHLAPAELRTEMFGLYALSGKVTSFAGPAVLAWATLTFESQRAGMTTIIAFFAVGLVSDGLRGGAQAVGAPTGQWRKCRLPVKTMAMPRSSAAAITSSSRIEPPGWIIAVAPASAAAISPSANGRNASDAATEPTVAGSASPASRATSPALRAAMRVESTRLI